MHILFRIIYAAHASGTHHKLALDALRQLRCAQAEPWQRLFLDHAGPYLEGSKAPDNHFKDFKDFKNHVLHPRDGFWGGAPDKVRSWYGQLVDGLGQEQWPTAAYAAGVLGHYYTDPLQPFHTGQSEAENKRPMTRSPGKASRSSRHSQSRCRRAPTGWPSSCAGTPSSPTPPTRS
jgi:hypothetical protein